MFETGSGNTGLIMQIDDSVVYEFIVSLPITEVTRTQ